MSIVVPMTTEIRGGECEVAFPKPPWLMQTSVANVLGVAGVDNAKVLHRLGTFPKPSFDDICRTLLRALGFDSAVPLA
jgi:mRNA-degrading endonuclease toxin of MazEF toxin-antitoxin module